MDDRYHRAARDGRLDLLKEAFKKELNQTDDDGMTPTLWSAYHGNLSALQLCCKRGGDVDKCDYTGNSALHLAAQNGHLDCLTFLVRFGVNLWQLDNEYNTALAIAGNRGQDNCVQYLDDAMNKERSKNKKRVASKTEKAKKEAEIRIKKYVKLQEKQQKKMEKIHYGVVKRRLSSVDNADNPTPGRRLSTVSTKNFSETTTDSKPTQPLFMTESNATAHQFIISKNGREQSQTLSGFPSQQVSNVFYVPSETMSTGANSYQSRRTPIHNVFPETEEDESPAKDEMPAFGTIALRHNFKSANAMYSVLGSGGRPQDDSEDSVMPSFSKPVLKRENEDEELDSSSDEEESNNERPLETFLESLKLYDYLPLFEEQKMDMETLMLCSAEDLKEMGLALGPRKKIMVALKERKESEQVSDSELTLF